MSLTTQQITFILFKYQYITHESCNKKKYNIMKTSVTVINIPECMEISIKGPPYAYRVTSEY